MRHAFAIIMLSFMVVCLPATVLANNFTIEKVIDGLENAWGMDFLPDGSALVTEKSGRLWHIKDGRKSMIAGIPAVEEVGQGGLLDIAVARDFSTSRMVFFSFTDRYDGGTHTVVAKAQLSTDNQSLENTEIIFKAQPPSGGGRHFGSRIVEAPDGTLFITIGERGNRPSAQSLSSHNGSVVRINKDGSVPADNPFVGKSPALPEIWSYGHRNPQGADLDLQGNLWVSEHGARGGDEVNRVLRGANYGWPVISYGRHYSGLRIGEGTHKEGMEQPQFYWDPSMAPSGMIVYSGKLWQEWQGDIFVGSLKFDYISHLSGQPLQEVNQIKTEETLRVRDVAEANDGSIWFISEIHGAIYRMTPN